ncbi:MAG: GNAT family N-acetyltransferase [Anaerolineae bacterium]|nr:GNAT family N-acetyltransferase [Anaerolineae bacterium]
MHPVAPSHPVLPVLFGVPHLHFVVTAMEVGNSPALAWVDDTHMPTSALIWDRAHNLYFGGDAHNATFNASLRDFVVDNLVAEARQRAFGILKLYAVHDDWLDEIVTFLPDLSVQAHARVLYRLNPSADLSQPPKLPNHMRLVLIDNELLQTPRLTGISAVMQEIEDCWTSPEHFVDQAFGYCIIHDTDGIISWCTAEYFSPGVCGIGIETLQPYQRQGLATITARAFAQHATRLGWQVNWDAWLKNTPSIRVAEKIGFEKVLDYQIGVVVLT